MKWIIDDEVSYSDMKMDTQIVGALLNKAAYEHDKLDEGMRIGIKALARGMLYSEERKKPKLSGIYRPPKGKTATRHMLDLFGVMMLEVLRNGELSITTERIDGREARTVKSISIQSQSKGESGGQVVDRGSNGGRQDDFHESIIEELRTALSYIEDIHS